MTKLLDLYNLLEVSDRMPEQDFGSTRRDEVESNFDVPSAEVEPVQDVPLEQPASEEDIDDVPNITLTQMDRVVLLKIATGSPDVPLSTAAWIEASPNARYSLSRLLRLKVASTRASRVYEITDTGTTLLTKRGDLTADGALTQQGKNLLLRYP